MRIMFIALTGIISHVNNSILVWLAVVSLVLIMALIQPAPIEAAREG